MKNSISTYVITSRFRQASERKRNIIVCVAAVLVGFMISLSNNIFTNTSKDILAEIERTYGKYDVSIVLNGTEKMELLNKTLENHKYVIAQYDKEVQDDYNLIAIKSISDYFKYNEMASLNGNAIITNDLSDTLGVHENEKTMVNGKEYEIAIVSDDINCILNNGTKSMLVENSEIVWKYPVYLLYLNHSTEEIKAIQKKVSGVLNAEDYIMSSNYNTYRSMLEDMGSLRSALVFFVLVIIVLSGFMILFSYNNVLTERIRYWNTLCCIGLSKMKMLLLIGAELAVYVGVGGLLGIILGNIGSLLICKFTDIRVFIAYPNLITFVETFIVCLINILLIVLRIKKKIKNISIIEMKNLKKPVSLNSQGKVFRFVSGIFVVITVLLSLFVYIKGESLLPCVALVVLSAVTIFILINYFCDLHKYFVETKNNTLYLCGTNMKSHYMLTKGMSVALTVTFVILFLLNSVLQAYQQTAISAVDRQLRYDLMAYKENTETDKDLDYINQYTYSMISENIGKFNSTTSIYLCGLKESDMLEIYSEEIFEEKKWDGRLQNNQMILSQYVANIYGINVGDTISILYDNKEYNMEICSLINTNDFLSQVAYFNIENSQLSQDFKADKTYYYFKGNSNEIESLKSYFENNKEFVVMDITDVKEQWIDNTSAALKPMRIFAGVICITLLIVALCMLFSANKEKKYDYSLMILMGYRQKKIYRIVFLEIMSVVVTSILIGYIFLLLCNSSVIYVLGLISNYKLLLVGTWKDNLLIFLTMILCTGLIVWIFSKKLMKKDIYNILVKGVERC